VTRTLSPNYHPGSWGEDPDKDQKVEPNGIVHVPSGPCVHVGAESSVVPAYHHQRGFDRRRKDSDLWSHDRYG